MTIGVVFHQIYVIHFTLKKIVNVKKLKVMNVAKVVQLNMKKTI